MAKPWFYYFFEFHSDILFFTWILCAWYFSKCAYFQREIFFNEIRNQSNNQRVVRIFEQTSVPSFVRELEVAQLYENYVNISEMDHGGNGSRWEMTSRWEMSSNLVQKRRCRKSVQQAWKTNTITVYTFTVVLPVHVPVNCSRDKSQWEGERFQNLHGQNQVRIVDKGVRQKSDSVQDERNHEDFRMSKVLDDERRRGHNRNGRKSGHGVRHPEQPFRGFHEGLHIPEQITTIQKTKNQKKRQYSPNTNQKCRHR